MKRSVLEYRGGELNLEALSLHFDPFVFLEYGPSGKILALGQLDKICPPQGEAFESLKSYQENNRDWLFGHLSYDLKNELEALESNNPDHVGFPDLQFFRPIFVILEERGRFFIHYPEDLEKPALQELLALLEGNPMARPKKPLPDLQRRMDKGEYIRRVKKLQEHIQGGDIYEINFCQEFYADGVSLAPASLFQSLQEETQAPFSGFYRLGQHFLLCGSPERFIQKKGAKIISQPIKGTRKRSCDPGLDALLKKELEQDPKERAENIMIVDLVRNDLSKIAEKGSVRVEELCGIYSFNTVHQMISTISCELPENKGPIEAIEACFPMGSMTGAPKFRAMELIDQYELSRRGMYSGALGYFSPEGDFDFNVVIRSLAYNAKKNYLSLQVGGAITIKSDPEKEYEECLLKAQGLFKAMGTNEGEI